MKLCIALLFSLVPQHLFSLQDCKDLPKDAVKELKAPFDKWIKFKCLNKKGLMSIVPVDGMSWTAHSSKSKPVMVVAGDSEATAPLSDPETLDAPKKWTAYFVKQGSRKYKGMGVMGANMMLHQETKAPAKYGRIYHLALTANNKRSHQLIFYSATDKPDWVLICTASCKTKYAFKVNR